MLEEIKTAVKNHPWIVLLIIAAVVYVIYALYKSNTAAAAAAVSTTPAPPLSTETYNQTFNSYPTSTTPTSTTPTGTTTTTTTSGGTTQNTVLRIRSKGSLGNSTGNNWDATHSGVPIRATPSGSGSVTSLAAFGTSVTATGAEVSGGADSATGSAMWWPISGGYINSGDTV